LRTTVGASEGAGFCGAVEVGAVAVGAVLVGAVLVGAAGVVAAVVVSAGVVLTGGVVEVVVEDWPASGCWEAPAPASEAVAEEPSVGTGVALAVAPSAPPASGPPRPAAVNPPPASAESIARRARRRALFRGGIL